MRGTTATSSTTMKSTAIFRRPTLHSTPGLSPKTPASTSAQHDGHQHPDEEQHNGTQGHVDEHLDGTQRVQQFGADQHAGAKHRDSCIHVCAARRSQTAGR